MTMRVSARRQPKGLYDVYLKPLAVEHRVLPHPSPGEQDAGDGNVESAEAALAEVLDAVGCGKGLRKLACDLLQGEPTNLETIDLEERLDFLHEWLRFCQSDSSLARMRWAALSESKDPRLEDRDEYVGRLWRKIKGGEGAEGRFREHVERKWCPWPYYERHFFSWFLSRFDLVHARNVFEEGRGAGSLDYTLLALSVVIIGGIFLLPPLTLLKVVAGIAGVGLAFYAAFRWSNLPGYAFVHSLVPRMAAAVGVGYLFLVGATGLVNGEQPWYFLTTIAFGVAGASLAYIVLHIYRRVHPPLQRPHLRQRSVRLFSLAALYAAIELLIAAPVVLSPELLSEATPVHTRASHLILCAAIAINIGVIVQLAWDEKPLTEPL
jgi:hypothetical protein